MQWQGEVAAGTVYSIILYSDIKWQLVATTSRFVKHIRFQYNSVLQCYTCACSVIKSHYLLFTVVFH